MVSTLPLLSFPWAVLCNCSAHCEFILGRLRWNAVRGYGSREKMPTADLYSSVLLRWLRWRWGAWTVLQDCTHLVPAGTGYSSTFFFKREAASKKNISCFNILLFGQQHFHYCPLAQWPVWSLNIMTYTFILRETGPVGSPCRPRYHRALVPRSWTVHPCAIRRPTIKAEVARRNVLLLRSWQRQWCVSSITFFCSPQTLGWHEATQSGSVSMCSVWLIRLHLNTESCCLRL